jgi:hypothetical protein
MSDSDDQRSAVTRRATSIDTESGATPAPASVDLGRSATTPFIDLALLESELSATRAEYATATPFPHRLFEDFLPSAVVDQAIKEFPRLNADEWNGYVHANERKFANTDPDTWGPTLQAILHELNSSRFVEFLSDLTGIEGLIADPSLEGGGLHQSTAGGFLNIHADFTVHPHHRNWQRRVNLLLYLNDDWKPEYGGDLELWTKDMKRCEKTIAPIANRVCIFTTDTDSFHGHPNPNTCPEDVTRRSLALYYFTIEEKPFVRSTEYRGRPGDGLHALTIYADKQVLRGFDWAKRRLGISDAFARKLLGFTDRFRRKGPPRT